MLARDAYYEQPYKETEITVSFGEYANPSFESQVETISKAKSGGIMSVEASVDELYGDTKDETWKSEEVTRLKAEQGITEMEEPQVAQSTPTGVSKGDIVTFTGGGVYKSSTADHASVEKDAVSTCKVTAINTKGTHPYHCISQDGKGIYGWVNKEDVK